MFYIVKKETLEIVDEYDSLEKQEIGGRHSVEEIYAHVEAPEYSEFFLNDKGEITARPNETLLKIHTVKEARRNTLNQVLAKAKELFGTSKTDTLTADNEEYKMMLKHPESFVGEAFESEEDVISYAETQQAKVLEFFKFRLQKKMELKKIIEDNS